MSAMLSAVVTAYQFSEIVAVTRYPAIRLLLPILSDSRATIRLLRRAAKATRFAQFVTAEPVAVEKHRRNAAQRGHVL